MGQASGGENEENLGEMESRSPTPTPPVLEPEVPIKLPTPAAPGKEPEPEETGGSNDTEDSTDQSMEEEPKHIPRLLDAAGTSRSRDHNLEPSTWTVQNVTSFLEINECSNLVYNFTEAGVDGVRFLTLTKQEVMSIVNNKMGPCLKIEHLQKLLKEKLNPAQTRLLASLQKK